MLEQAQTKLLKDQSQQRNCSLAESIAYLSDDERRSLLSSFSEHQSAALLHDWRFWARPNQIIPGTPGAAEPRSDWVFWLALAGRGWGKTRVGSESVRDWARDPKARILMIAPTASDVRDVMIEGPSGLMSCYPPDAKPFYIPSRHLLQFPSGAVGITRSADEPERLRGPQFTKFWADELCAWRYPTDAWDQIMFGFRLKSERLQGIITTTPKPIGVLKELVQSKDCVVTRGSSYENRLNLSETYYEKVIAPYEGTRLGRQEIYAEILTDIPGALWKQQMIDATRIRLGEVRWDLLTRIVVAVDPAVSKGENSAETGIVVVALTQSGHVVVLDDLSLRGSPEEWGTVVVNAYRSKRADKVVGEVNNGGDLVGSNLMAIAPNIPFRAVHASRGKYKRAEPVAALYERGRVHHVGVFGELERQMTEYVPGSEEASPDRMDALVWGITELLIDQEEVGLTVQVGQWQTISSI